ncbi:hypothetical protein Pstr01_27320 [Pseudomonas straminea]|nr:hypothetical protein Pstr01_27320 [Pseudomonas straminea]
MLNLGYALRRCRMWVPAMPSGTMQRDVGAASAAISLAVACSIAAKAAPTKPTFSALEAYYRAEERL